MISLRHSEAFKKAYSTRVPQLIDEHLSQNEKRILKRQINNLFPEQYRIDELTELVTLSPETLSLIISSLSEKKLNSIVLSKSKKKGVENKFQPVFYKYYRLYEKLRDLTDIGTSGDKTSIAIMKSLEITVCPYCNRDYINPRGENKSGAQLDHFYSRGKYPFLSISLYNLVPACYNCNHSKLDYPIDYSPFNISDQSCRETRIFSLNFDYHNEVFRSKTKLSLFPTNSSDSDQTESLKKNFEVMKLKEAYEIHNNEVHRICQLSEIYSESQRRELKMMVGNSRFIRGNHSLQNLDYLLYGFHFDEPDFKNQPLSKMKYDILKELGIID